ncbi:MAG: rhomboid family intramembrane serine protease, partial [Lachnospiraceae bacterium]|nr:rhomboid family intramembrane serine protease [Lachnospiraceae bacterium]
MLIFISIYFISPGNKDALLSFGATGMDYLNREYYRWITCLFLHYNIGHLFVNSAVLLSVRFLLGSFVFAKISAKFYVVIVFIGTAQH